MKKREVRPEILDQLYQISKMGMEASEIVLPKVRDQRLREQIKKQSEAYADAMRQSRAMLQEMRQLPGELRPAAKRALRSAFRLGSNVRRDPGHFAGMMISGASAGISTLAKALDDFPDEPPKIRWLAERYIDSEERRIESMREFL